MAASRVTIGIQSIGDMGLGVAKLLSANGYRVVTNAAGRSPATHARANAASVEILAHDRDLILQCDYIFSIVPPRDARENARRIAGLWPTFKDQRNAAKPSTPLYYLDLNATSPKSASDTNSLFEQAAPEINFVDGGIIGGPPKLNNETQKWYKPSVVCSGPHSLADAAPALDGKRLAEILNMKHVTSLIGSASGLKMCFASLSKGYTAIAIQAYTTALTLDVLDELKAHMKIYNPKGLENADRSLVAMPPKAYRWVAEMQEIADTFSETGFSKGMFEGARDTYETVADDTDLGKEITESRVRGKDSHDVALLMAEGLKRKKEKTE